MNERDSPARVARFFADGKPIGDIPLYGDKIPTTWYLLVSGWSGDGKPVIGAIDQVSTECSG